MLKFLSYSFANLSHSYLNPGDFFPLSSSVSDPTSQPRRRGHKSVWGGVGGGGGAFDEVSLAVIDWCRTVHYSPSEWFMPGSNPNPPSLMMNVIKRRFFFSKDASVKAVLTGKTQTRKPQNQLGQCGRGIKATVASGQIFFSRAQGHEGHGPSWHA